MARVPLGRRRYGAGGLAGATAVDGDMTFCLASGQRPADPMVVAAVAAELVSEAIRDAVRSATALPGCPAPAAGI